MVPLVYLVVCVSLFCSETLGQLGDRKDPDTPQVDRIPLESITPAPALRVDEALKTFHYNENFDLEIVASDPMIHDPVTLAFDGNGRMWIAEMRNLMPNIDGTGEDEPVGRISIVEDTDGDGEADKHTVFLNNIIFPRAVALYKNGLIYADHRKLYFVEKVNDKAGKIVVIDEQFAPGLNVENEPNSFMRALDNWYYNAAANYRYREIDGKWVKERSSYRGHWGISQDDQGRLFYNTQARVMMGDEIRPDLLLRNPYYTPKEKPGKNIGPNQVFPIRMTPGVNRGYQRNILDKEGRLLRPTATCGPVIYRGDQFPKEYSGRAFACEPAANLVKMMTIHEDEDGTIVGREGFEGSEFLASTDERFRPVNLYTAPDGSLYMVDLYRGILQHKLSLTSYLRRQILSRGLDKVAEWGRVYRIRYKDNPLGPKPELDRKRALELVPFLSHPNGWWRDTAQRLIVESGDISVAPVLTQLAGDGEKPLAQIHALWTLEGLGAVNLEAVEAALASRDNHVIEHAINVSEKLALTGDSKTLVRQYVALASSSNHLPILRQLAMSLGRFSEAEALEALKELLLEYGDRPYFKSAVLSGLLGQEAAFKSILGDTYEDKEFLEHLDKSLNKVGPKKYEAPENKLHRQVYELGKTHYLTHCAACHNSDGQGLPEVGPPLVGSEWVTGSETQFAKIVLQGLTGPVTVDGKTYKLVAAMPAFKVNPTIGDSELAEIATYVRYAWGNGKNPIDKETFADLRISLMGRSEPFTIEEIESK